MQMIKFNFRLFLLCLLVSFLLINCITDNRTAGTSTTVTNPPTVTGMVILAEGKPAAHAEIALRTRQVIFSDQGIPASKLIASTITDDSGKFTFPSIADHDIYMEIKQNPTALPIASKDSLQVFLRGWIDGLPLKGQLGTFRLANPGTMAGQFLPDSLFSDSARWVGIRGTANFAAMKNNRFKLRGICPGIPNITLVKPRDPTDTSHIARITGYVVTDSVQAGKDIDFGTVTIIGD